MPSIYIYPPHGPTGPDGIALISRSLPLPRPPVVPLILVSGSLGHMHYFGSNLGGGLGQRLLAAHAPFTSR
eukprot:scaffold24722_cov35-Tisochrysis_lutea.AAC.2